jgi:hypothetical protein
VSNGPDLRVRHRLAAVLIGLTLLLSAGGGVGAGAPTGDDELKAAFVMNFVKFVEWPHQPPAHGASAFVITVLGDGPFGATLARAAAGQKPGARALTVRTSSDVHDAQASHIVFIGRAEERRLAAILRALEDQPVLTVGDTRGFAEAGVVLNLYTFDHRVRIEVNTTAAARAQLRLSAHLLRIARIVG